LKVCRALKSTTLKLGLNSVEAVRSGFGTAPKGHSVCPSKIHKKLGEKWTDGLRACVAAEVQQTKRSNSRE